MKMRLFIAIALFFTSITSYSGTLKITILSSMERTKSVYFPNTRLTSLSVIPILFNGLESDGISEGNHIHASIDRVFFDFDDDMSEVVLSETIQERLLKWLKNGSASCVNYSTNPYRLLAETGKSFIEEDQKETKSPNGFSFAFFLNKGITDFTGLGFNVDSHVITIEDLKPGDMAVLRSSKTECVLQAMLYVGNEIFMSMAQGVIYFQTITHIKQLWDPANSSTLELVQNIRLPELAFGTKNQSDIDSVNGYMRPIDMLLPPTGSYIQ